MPEVETDQSRVAHVLDWESDIPLVTSRFMWWDFLRVSVLASTIMWTLVAFMGWIIEGEPAVLPWQVVPGVTGVLLALFVLASLLLGNRHGARFILSEAAVAYEAGRREKRVNTAVAILGLLAGSPGTAGAGLLAKGQESRSWAWSEIHAMRAYPGPRVISLRNSWRVVLRLHVPAQLWDAVVELCERRIAQETAVRSAREAKSAAAARTASRPLWSRAVWATACVVLSFLMQAWYWIEPAYEGWTRVGFIGGLLIAGAAALEGVGRRVLGAAGLLGLLAQAWALGVSALDPIGAAYGAVISASLDTPTLVLAGTALAALFAIGGWRVVGGER